ncbi:putative Bacteriophage protein [Vibrio chagasii]|nr:putative Bacteriophage protein [Vibrio chagasii]CAH7305581.1 putative Bacteriophage protein [Vibrio chagasii]
MNMNDGDRFIGILEANMALYNRELSQAVMEIWFDDLKSHDIGSIEQAFQMHRRNPDNGQYPPKPADIEKLIGGTSDDRALIAWSKVKKAIGEIGAHNSLVFDDPLIHAVITDMGDWVKICRTSDDEFPFVAKEFERRYRSGLYNPPQSHPKKLVGISEQQNFSSGFDHIDAPLTLGDKEACRLVYRTGGNAATRVGVLLVESSSNRSHGALVAK